MTSLVNKVGKDVPSELEGCLVVLKFNLRIITLSMLIILDVPVKA